MNVKLRYFAWVRERVGKPEETVEIPPGVATVSDLMTWLASRGCAPVSPGGRWAPSQ